MKILNWCSLHSYFSATHVLTFHMNPTLLLSVSPSSTPPGSQEQNATDINPTLPPTIRPISSQVSVCSNAVLSSPEGWYPSWTGDARGCLNDGLQPSYMNGYLSDTLVDCCDEYFALDENPMDCLGIDSYIDAFKCDGADFNRDYSDLVPNTVLFVCIKSKSSDVGIDYLNSMVSNSMLVSFSSLLFKFLYSFCIQNLFFYAGYHSRRLSFGRHQQ